VDHTDPLPEDPKNIQRATHLLMVAQALERMSDHATNIAERVIYLVTGTRRSGQGGCGMH